MITVAAVAAWLLSGWLGARWLFLHEDPEDGADVAFAVFIIVCGPAGLGAILMISVLEGWLPVLSIAHRVDWGTLLRKTLAIRG